MDDSTRHAGQSDLSSNTPLPLREGQPVVDKENQDQPQIQDHVKEVFDEQTGGGVPAQWARVSRLAVRQLDRCVTLEPKVLKGGDPDAIHDLRVATRRLQQVLDLAFPPPRSGEIRKLRRRLRRCRRSLSEVRNYDVLLERVDAALARKRTARREAWEAIGAYLKDTRSLKREKALRKLARTNLSEIYVRLKECLQVGGHSSLAAEASGHPCSGPTLNTEQFYARISDSLQMVWETLEREVNQSRHETDPAGLHRTRIAAKRVRYLIEVIHAFDVPGSKEALIWLRSLQKHLGRWHDLVIFEDTVIGMIADSTFLRDQMNLALEVERLLLGNRALKAKLERKYVEMTTDRAGFVKTREWVQRIVESPVELFAELS